jgi:SAM-dependent methyltransferase
MYVGSEWDARYGKSGYTYGTEPNGFLRSVIDAIPLGRILSLGEGEGRNAVFLAEHGCDVLGVDASSVGLSKAQSLAKERGVHIRTEVRDIREYPIAPTCWDGILSIFCHLPANVRHTVHQRVVSGLKPGGVFVLEAYTPRQLEYGTGGPPVRELLVTLDELRGELEGLRFDIAREIEREVREGRLHGGMGAVVQVFAVKPPDDRPPQNRS